jgi:hypothetical protein
MRFLALLSLAGSAFAQFPSQCALGLQFSFRFDLNNDSVVSAVASSLNWQLDESSTSSYGDAAKAQVKKDVLEAVPSVGDLYDSGIAATSTGNLSATYHSYFSLGLAICDDKLATPKNTAAATLETALLDPTSTLRNKNMFWQYFVGNESFSYSSQFKFELLWTGNGIKSVWNSQTSDDEVRTALGQVAGNASSRVRAPTFGGGSSIDFIYFLASVETAIDAQTDAPYTSDPTRWDVYNMIRAAILDPASSLRTNDKYFKVWVSPTGTGSKSNSFAVLQPLWAILAALMAFV